MTTDEQVAALAARAEDEGFAGRLYEDPIGTLRQEGYGDFAGDVQRELTRIDGLLRQILGDEEFRELVEQEPIATLTEWGLPEDAVEPVLAIMGAPEDVARRAAGDMELHGKRTPPSAAAAAAVLGALAFAQSATAASPEGFRYRGVEPAASKIVPLAQSSLGVRWGALNPNAVRYGGGLRAMVIRDPRGH
jgi:hypothetical protein